MQVLKEEVLYNILSSSKELFLKNGYEKTSMERIAKKAGISKSNLYNYFKSKEEIFYHLVDKGAENIKSIIRIFKEKVFDNEEELLYSMTEYLCKSIIPEKDALILIYSSSNGTKYEGLMNELIEVIARKIENYLSKEKNYIVSKIIATNLLSGFFEICKSDLEESEVYNNLEMISCYQANSIKMLKLQ